MTSSSKGDKKAVLDVGAWLFNIVTSVGIIIVNKALMARYGFTFVYHDGTLCMDIIQDAWSPCHNVATILTSIQSLLTDPNPSSPANPEAAQLFQHDIQAYNKRVRRCARKSIECS